MLSCVNTDKPSVIFLIGIYPYSLVNTNVSPVKQGKLQVHKSAYDKNSNLFDLEVINTSEINKEAVLSYAAVHCGLTQEMIDTYKDYPTREEMARQLTEINLGYEPEKDKRYDWYKVARKKSNEIEKYWLACKLSHNLGDINKIEFSKPLS